MTSHERSQSTHTTLQTYLQRVLELQPKWTKLNSAKMQERGIIVRDSLPEVLTNLLSTHDEPKYHGFSVQGKDGIGLKIRVPWVRLFLHLHSPSARQGWYAAYLFAFDGSRVCLSLNQGTTASEKGESPANRLRRIKERASVARTLLASLVRPEHGLDDTIELRDPSPLARGYEAGNVYAKTYYRGSLPDASVLTSDLDTILSLLLKLYRSEDHGPDRDTQVYWFVGAYWEENGDQTDRFIESGIWENGYTDRYLDEVRSIQPGDRIAIKSTYTRKRGLPFESGGNRASEMKIKATGTVTHNLGDGRRLMVDWTRCVPPRLWYFFTHQRTVWKVERTSWYKEALIDFTFNEEPQDLARFRNDPYWRERFGDVTEGRYTIDDILTDGCFLERIELETILDRLAAKKNLILQGPPGTGKSWLARRLAFAFIGSRDESKVKVVQFHPNLSYEDFVRGLRPGADGTFSIVDGPFMKMVSSALAQPSSPHVIVIEEINRGNPAQIFGEILTLLEADRRTPADALELCHSRSVGERVFLPENLYVIGTMNIADRSLALVDFALRRRFAFVDLEPRLGVRWRAWVSEQSGMHPRILVEVEKRIVALNDRIEQDPRLGPQFRIGHSFVTPAAHVDLDDGYAWFKRIVNSEIGPLLEEYWFDALHQAREARQHLLEGL